MKYLKDLSAWLDLLRSSMVEKALVGYVRLDLGKFLKLPFIFILASEVFKHPALTIILSFTVLRKATC
jgi:hypothetical protein